MSILSKAVAKFRGGIHPADNKELTSQNHIQVGPVPSQVSVLLSQHIGQVCSAIVAKKDSVTAGQKVGDAEAFVSAPVHSPVNGVVKEIGLASHPVLGRIGAVIIEPSADNTQPQPGETKFDIDFDENTFEPARIVDAVRQAGVVGMGGAGFPTAVKLKANPTTPIDTVVVNGCECEPYITCDYRMMLEWAPQIIIGARLARHALAAKEIIFAVEDNKPAAIDALKLALERGRSDVNIKIVSLKTRYPQGGERQLIKAAIGRVVPTGAVPPKVGVLVSNVATCAAIADAVIHVKPLTHRVVTVTGRTVAKPGNYYVAIGTPISELIDFCGGLGESAAKVILGGPMMGIATCDLSTPVTKTTSAITILSADEVGKTCDQPQSACIRCGRCVGVCPIGLVPTRIAHAVKAERYDLAQDYNMNACVECGSCSFVCPANIELAAMIKVGKLNELRKRKK